MKSCIIILSLVLVTAVVSTGASCFYNTKKVETSAPHTNVIQEGN